MVVAQFNPSTLKAKYTSATGKVQMTVPIGCPPGGIVTITISGVSECNPPANWPNNNIIGTHNLPFSYETSAICVWQITTATWYWFFSYYKSDDKVKIIVGYTVGAQGYHAFSIAKTLYDAGVANNAFIVGMCNGEVPDAPPAIVSGYGGSVAW